MVDMTIARQVNSLFIFGIPGVGKTSLVIERFAAANMVEGKDYLLNRTMQPLAQVKDKIQVIGGLTDLSAMAGEDGGGDHARANGTFLTGVRIKKTGGADFHAGISADQVMAQQLPR